MTVRRLSIFALWFAAFATMATLATAATAQSVSFGIFGDLPYGRWERQNIPALIKEMDDARLDFIIHVGDIKSGSAECNDAAYRDILGLFENAATPLIYTPGDNDWTDCHRLSNGSFDPLERLDFVRKLFFASPSSLGRRQIALLRQERYPENARWQQGPVTVVTLNITGSNNNYFGTGTTGPDPEFIDRSEANQAWLDDAFAAARRFRSKAIVIAFQANPQFQRETNKPYGMFLDQVRREAQSFEGKVLLVHGDTHRVRVDQPLMDASGTPVANVIRVETFGSPHFGWVRVDFGLPGQPSPKISPQYWNPAAAQ